MTDVVSFVVLLIMILFGALVLLTGAALAGGLVLGSLGVIIRVFQSQK